MTTAYLAGDGHTERLAGELKRAGVTVRVVHGRLFVTDDSPIDGAWAQNIWYDAVEIPIASIGDAATRLRARQRTWAPYAPVHRGRTSLITEKLPPLSSRPLGLGELAPPSPLGSFTLLEPNLMLAAERCSSAFPNGEVALAELRVGPPNRAYRKLWEAFVVMGKFPQPGDLAVDLGASPGGWTWLLAELGCRVVAVDKAPLDAAVASRPTVEEVLVSAFGLFPSAVHDGRPPRWVTADIACYPERLFPLIERWSAVDPAPGLVFTIKFQGDTDHDVIDRLRRQTGARLAHLHHNKHELTLMLG
jgi:23S rRNA (cytidine2498-2'-O)-methyltransferase